MKLKNRVSLITGGTKGIGEAVARRFAKEGSDLILLGRDEIKGKSLKEELSKKYKVSVNFYMVDFNNSTSLRDTIFLILSKYDVIDILVNNAGTIFEGTVEDTSDEDFDEIFRVNVKSPFIISQMIIPAMRENGGGSIVNIGSSAGIVGAKFLHAYSATKSAIIGLTRSMASSYAKDNIRVNVVCPGATNTSMLDGVDKGFIKSIPMERAGEPEEIANGILFLSCDDSSFITGSVLTIDGGFTAI